MNTTINIVGLTDREVALLKGIWACKTQDALETFQLLLKPQDLMTSIALIQLLKIEYIDLQQTESGDLTLAQTLIQSIQK